jgi:hypothetical protein
VLRPSSLPPARAVVAATAAGLAGVLASMVVALAPAAAVTGPTSSTTSSTTSSAKSAAPAQPLVPRIRSITPDYVPEKGPIVIRGVVTNDSHRTWTAINVHGFMGSTPITTSADLAAALQEPLDADVGSRITVPGTFDSIPSLAPGQTAHFVVRLPRHTLPLTTPGVYWFGVHVLGDNGRGGARQAVGRDRTFLPYVPGSLVSQGEQEDAALVVPVRSGVVRGPDGTVIDPDGWGRSLTSGPLHDILETGRAAAGHPLTWLLDPAVTDVVRRLAHGNPARTLTSPRAPHQAGEPPSPSTSSSSAGSSGSSATGPSGTVPTAATRRVAAHWLQRMHSLLRSDTGEVLGLPYGDLAVEPAAAYDRPLLRSAFRRTDQALSAWGLSAGSVVAPPDGRTLADSVAALPRATEVLLADTGVSGAAHTVDRVVGHRVVLTSPATAQGGPGPVNPHSSLAMRQRILAEAALRLLGDQQPLVVELPPGLESRIRPSFFSGLDVPWLSLTTLAGAADVTPTSLDPERLRAPSPDEPAFGEHLYDSAREVITKGDTLQSVLVDNHVLRRRLFEEVAGNASYAAQQEPYLALARMRVSARWVGQNLDAIGIAAPESVTLASTSGRFSVFVSNDLDVSVRVQVQAAADPRLRITGGQLLTLPPHGRASVLLNASTHERGVHTVTLEVTSPDGRPVGARDEFPMRSEQVSELIWVIIGIGVALLFAAIAVRLTRRILQARAARRTGS